MLGDGGIVVNHYDELSDTVKLCFMYDTLLASVKLAEEYKICMNLEGLNIKVDHVGNFLQMTQMATEVTRLINSPYLMILFDAYHMQYKEGALRNFETSRLSISRRLFYMIIIWVSLLLVLPFYKLDK